jgi:hypothetical protein
MPFHQQPNALITLRERFTPFFKVFFPHTIFFKVCGKKGLISALKNFYYYWMKETSCGKETTEYSNRDFSREIYM